MTSHVKARRAGLKSHLAGMIVLVLATSLDASPDTQLVDAAKRQDAAAVRSLLEQGVDVDEPQADGATALHWAVYWSDLETAELLIHGGADVNAANDLGVSPLSLACGNGDAPMVDALLRAGADPNAGAKTRPSALMLCARTGNADAVERLLAHGADANAREPFRGQTAVMWAVAQRHPEVVRELVDHGADIHTRSQVRPRFVNIGDPNANDPELSIAGTIESGGSTPLLFAARQGALESARLLVQAGANVDDTAADGTSALVMAAHSGHGALARFLIESGAHPNDGRAGYTALHAAVLRGDRSLVEVLVARGADLNATVTRGTPVTRAGPDFILPHNLVGATPCLLAAKFLEVDILQVLVASGADTHVTLEDGTTPLMVAAGLLTQPGLFDRRNRIVDPVHRASLRPAAEGRARQAVRLLVDHGASVTVANQRGFTALHGAAIHDDSSLVRFLVERGARLDVKNDNGQTPLDVAADPEMAELLRTLGADE